MNKQLLIFLLIFAPTLLLIGCRKDLDSRPLGPETIVFDEDFNENNNWVLTADTNCTANIENGNLTLTSIAPLDWYPNWTYATASKEIPTFEQSDFILIKIKLNSFKYSYDWSFLPSSIIDLNIGDYNIKTIKDTKNYVGGFWKNQKLEILIDRSKGSATCFYIDGNTLSHIPQNQFFELSKNQDSNFDITFSTTFEDHKDVGIRRDGYSQIGSIKISTINYI